jgi:hypothetical protein
MFFALAAAGCDRLGRSEAVDDKAGSAARGAESTGKSCDDFATRICGQTANEFSTTCVNIKATAELLPPEACKVALANADYSIKALGRRGLRCDELRAKICADTRSAPKSCDRVKESTARFSEERCKEMLGRYDKVLVDVKQSLRIL